MMRVVWTCVVVALALAAPACEQGVCDESLMGQSIDDLPRLGDAGVATKGPYGYQVAGDVEFMVCDICQWNPDAVVPGEDCTPCRQDLAPSYFQELDAPFTGAGHDACVWHSGSNSALQNCKVWVRDEKVVGVVVRCTN
ncbi:MAG TPA: hypothetical protein VFA20_29130 [Myxococcaceae bacterium]|nr:hypothetical protein [Myxococcaceae bacterium]